MQTDYSQQELELSLEQLGILQGDNLFIHANIGFYGRMTGVISSDDLCSAFLQSLKKSVGDNGTIVFPTFSYSFCHGEVYNPRLTKSTCGIMSEYAIKQEDTVRSMDPNFSITAWGRLADYYTISPSHESFGKDSFWERFLESGGKIVCMNFDCGSTFVHYVERVKSVSYRFNKAFNGTIELENGKRYQDYAVHFVYENERDAPFFGRLDKKCREVGICKKAFLGKGTMLAMDVREYYNLISESISLNPRFLTREEEVI